MINIWLLAWSLTQANYTYEINRGPSLELGGGSSFNDVQDSAAVQSTARASYSFANMEDAYLSFGLEFVHQSFRFDRLDVNGNSGTVVKHKFIGDLSLMFYEFYNPFVFRAGVGAGAERRLARWSPQISYRGGLGWYFTPKLALFGDLAGRYILREMFGQRNIDNSLPIEATLSIQFDFWW